MSKSLEPMSNRHTIFGNTQRNRNLKNNVEAQAAYNDEYNTSQSSINNYMSQTNYHVGGPNMISVLGLVTSITEPCSTIMKKQKGASKSQ